MEVIVPDDTACARHLLAVLPGTSRVPPDRAESLIEAALAHGRSYGARYRGQDFARLLNREGFDVVLAERMGVRAQVNVTRSHQRVVVSQESVRQLAGHPAFGIDERASLNVHLAHEYFHVLEYAKKIEFPDAMRVSARNILGRRGLRVPYSVMEVSANSFARQACGLPALPAVLDMRSGGEE